MSVKVKGRRSSLYPPFIRGIPTASANHSLSLVLALYLCSAIPITAAKHWTLHLAWKMFRKLLWKVLNHACLFSANQPCQMEIDSQGSCGAIHSRCFIKIPTLSAGMMHVENKTIKFWYLSRSQSQRVCVSKRKRIQPKEKRVHLYASKAYKKNERFDEWMAPGQRTKWTRNMYSSWSSVKVGWTNAAQSATIPTVFSFKHLGKTEQIRWWLVTTKHNSQLQHEGS